MKLPSIDLSSLSAEPGKGNSLTCFASDSIQEWNDHIPSLGTVTIGERREAIKLLARYYNLCPCQLVAIVRLHRTALRFNCPWPPKN